MLRIDGGDGGGQVVRSAIGLSALTGTPVTITDVRGARPAPGLKRQHLAAIECLAAITSAETEGAELGSQRISFIPGPVTPGSYEANIETAGSTTLVADAVLPLALVIDRPLSVTVHGGTDVKWSPPADYLRRVKLPLLADHGLIAVIEVDRRGYYPEGGGEMTLRIGPSDLRQFDLVDRGALDEVSVTGSASADLAADEVARRLVRAARQELDDAGFPVAQLETTYDDAPSTGAAIVLNASYEDGALGASTLGEPGVPAESVASDAVESLRSRHRRPAAVDKYLADQLLGLLAIAGGELRIPTVTEHVRTSLAVLEAFGMPVETEPTAAKEGVLVSAPRRLDELRSRTNGG